MRNWFQIGIPLLAGVIAWLANEWRKRALDERLRREERYRQLLTYSRGFYEETPDVAARAKFIEELSLCWLYCPDDVIRAIYRFLDSVKIGATTSAAEKQRAFNELVLAMRRDLWSIGILRRTSLRPEEYVHISAS